MKKRIILPAIILTGVLAVGALGFTSVSAQSVDNYPPLVQKLAERFNLAPEDVQEVFLEVQDERKAQMYAHFADRLDDMVGEGKITKEQRDAILDKHEEMEAKMESLGDLDPEERHKQMREYHEEFRAWAEELGIDMPIMSFKLGEPHKGFKFNKFMAE